MSYDIKQDVDHFFHVFEDRTEHLFVRLPKPLRDKLEEELGLLRTSVQNRLDEESRS